MITVSNSTFENEQVEFMRGKISSGLGQAQYFLTREGYSRQFSKKLGFVPFFSTLNVLL
jgi:riboflavin kinase, archaea type